MSESTIETVIEFHVQSRCFVGGSPNIFGGKNIAGYWEIPADWETIGLDEYLNLAKRIATKQRKFAASQGGKIAEAVTAAAKANESACQFGDIRDIDDVTLGCVGSIHGARMYRQVQPDYSRSPDSWELAMERARNIESIWKWLIAARECAKKSPTAHVAIGFGDYDFRPVV